MQRAFDTWRFSLCIFNFCTWISASQRFLRVALYRWSSGVGVPDHVVPCTVSVYSLQSCVHSGQKKPSYYLLYGRSVCWFPNASFWSAQYCFPAGSSLKSRAHLMGLPVRTETWRHFLGTLRRRSSPRCTKDIVCLLFETIIIVCRVKDGKGWTHDPGESGGLR